MSTQIVQQRYQGFCKTHSLWLNGELNSLRSFKIDDDYSSVFLRELNKKRRLGQLAEQFLFNQIQTSTRTKLLAENLQIQNDSKTIGELDALIQVDGIPVHLEIVYKFYVFDEQAGDSEIEHWIGPNRKDSLIEKLEKLKKKQLPLLYSEHCMSVLERLELNALDIEQRVLFKAQLFVPYQKHVEFVELNQYCISGFYIRMSQLLYFKSHQFYIPEKLDWFIKPHPDVQWLDLKEFKSKSVFYLHKNQSPLFWMKNGNKTIKAFLVWW